MQHILSRPLRPGRHLLGLVLGATLSACGGGGGDSGGGTVSSFALAGSVSGLTQGGLVLANGSDTLNVSAGASGFTLPKAVPSGTAYGITVQTQPTGLTCSVAGGSGTMGNANVSNVTVTCVPKTFGLGGAIAGLTSNGLLLANGSDTLAVAANATTFALPAAVAFGSAYQVTVKAQTDEQTCTIANGSGTMGNAAVSDVGVSCVAARFSAVSTLAGSGQPGNADGSGATATFKLPAALAKDASGNLYVSDFDNNTIRRITPDGTVSTFAGSGAIGQQDGTGTAASFRAPVGLAFDGGGNLFVADHFNNAIRKITPSGVVTTIVPLKDSPFNQPAGLAVDAAGNLYVTDHLHHTIHKIAPDGTRTILAGATGVAGSTDGPGASARFNGPFGIAIDAGGNLFVADRFNHRVRRVAPDGTVSTVAGSGLGGHADGAAATARFNRPLGIAVGVSGHLYVADTLNHRIRVITPDGTVSTLAGTGLTGSADGAIGSAAFNSPFGVTVDGGGNVYVVDFNNNRVRKIARD